MTSRNAPRHSFAIRTCALAITAALGCAHVATAHAENLMDAYRQALQSDPVLKQAEAQQRIGQAGAAISLAPLLPQINGSVSLNDSHGTSRGSTLAQMPDGSQQFFNTYGSSGGLRSRTESLGLDQTLFDLGQFEDWRASKANARSTEAQYVAAQQNLILRVAQAYFTVLTDEDQLKFAQANEASLKKQLDQAQAKYDVGFAAITDVADAKAQHDAAVAQVISARDTLFNDREALAQITGQAPGTLETLTENLPLNPPQPDNMDEWVKTALASNPSLQAQRDLAESAQHSVTAAHAAHLPTLGASVSYSRNPAWGPGNLDNTGLPIGAIPLRNDTQRNDTTVGLVLSVPLFQGGGIIARERQAIAQRDQTNDVLEQDRRSVVSNTRNAFNAIEAGISSVEAQKAAVESAKTALDATQAGYQIGTRTIVDLLIAQQNYFQAQSGYSQARHAFVINQLNLKYSAGTLSVKDLEAVNTLLQ
ncbi:MAG TPA: TolC family outer membrane protein [Rhodanobacteraceae bacterium]|jgi:outer membrane protein|nr:TolC family outer membrane protein [Rhodanobacteraceae bacterium]